MYEHRCFILSADQKLPIYNDNCSFLLSVVVFVRFIAVGCNRKCIWTHGRSWHAAPCSQFDKLKGAAYKRIAIYILSLSLKTCFRFINAFVYQLVVC